MSNVIFGVPKVLGVLATRGSDVARSRDRHYWNPPTYLTVEPRDTSARTSNLRQSNVNGYRIQETDQSKVTEAHKLVRNTSLDDQEPHEPEPQLLAMKLMSDFTYRLDTNFAKIDRIDNDAIEEFKKEMIESVHLGRRVSDWTKIMRNLTTDSHNIDSPSFSTTIADLYRNSQFDI